jgi:hypothetical protein
MRILALSWLTLCCLAQEPILKPELPADGSLPTFGVTVVDVLGFHGQIYFLEPNTDSLPNFKKLKPVGSIYASRLSVPPQSFTKGFPGVTNRFEWFAIDYTGTFWISRPGKYRFALVSDDGSKLYIDDKKIIDNDGTHSPRTEVGSAKLKTGSHTIRVSYFQGPGDTVALMLGIAESEETEFRIFDMHDFLRPQSGDGSTPPPAGKH